MCRNKKLKQYLLNIVPERYKDDPYYEDKKAKDELEMSYLHFKTSVANTLSLTRTGSPATVNLEYCFDIENPEWVSLDTSSDVSIDLPANSTIYFKGTNETFNNSWTGNVAQETNYYHFNSDEEIYCAGNIMSILGTESVPDYAFHSLFKGFTNLKSAPELPATDTGTYCYLRMFMQSGITKAPKINSAIIKDYACYQICYKCVYLVSTPGLVCTEIKQYGLKEGYNSCWSLRNAPNMDSVEIIGNYGCSYMCTMYDHDSSLSQATSFKNLKSVGNYGMENFYGGCEKLKKASYPMKAETVGTNGWDEVFNGCFYLVEGPEYIEIQNPGARACISMFGHCRHLNKAPVIKIPALSSQCLYWMFIDSAVNEVRLESTSKQSNSLQEWFAWGSSSPKPVTGTIYHKEELTIPTNSNSGIPSGWTEVII